VTIATAPHAGHETSTMGGGAAALTEPVFTP
jgi:hypothetical protein